jgi:predicted AlkP superfamily phosphohydrolase/phosphomutase
MPPLTDRVTQRLESSERYRQLVIGLDAMEWALVEQWMGQGKMPTFQRLMQQGVRASLRSVSEQLPDTVWPAVFTGANPAKFEKYFYVQYDPATAGLKHVSDDVIQTRPFWEYLSDAGVPVGVVDVPHFKASRQLRGFQVSNWGSHATKTSRVSTPPELLTEIDRRFGKHPVGDCDATDCQPKALAGLKRRVLDGVRKHGELFRWVMRTREWETLVVAFSAPHCIGHHFWHWLDPQHPRHGEKDDYDLADAIEQVYRAIDRELGQMLEMVDSRTRLMVVAAHGMGPIYHASWNLPEILQLLGHGRTPHESRTGSGARSAKSEPKRTAKVNPWRVLKMMLPGRLQYAIKAMLPKWAADELLFRWYAGDRNWKGLRAFAIPNNDTVGAIRISVRGRDHDGLVEPGEPYRALCREISDRLMELTDPVTGKHVVKKVTLLHEEFQGPFVDGLPDLTVLWETSFPWSQLHSPVFGTLDIRRQDGRTGSHSDHGFALMYGPEVPHGQVLDECTLYDVAPTILANAGVPTPGHMDGQSLTARWLKNGE